MTHRRLQDMDKLSPGGLTHEKVSALIEAMFHWNYLVTPGWHF